jgi:hypothetical protein
VRDVRVDRHDDGRRWKMLFSLARSCSFGGFEPPPFFFLSFRARHTRATTPMAVLATGGELTGIVGAGGVPLGAVSRAHAAPSALYLDLPASPGERSPSAPPKRQ